ncbi:MAG: CNNM domain-containing protein [Collinsella sp.]
MRECLLTRDCGASCRSVIRTRPQSRIARRHSLTQEVRTRPHGHHHQYHHHTSSLPLSTATSPCRRWPSPRPSAPCSTTRRRRRPPRRPRRRARGQFRQLPRHHPGRDHARWASRLLPSPRRTCPTRSPQWLSELRYRCADGGRSGPRARCSSRSTVSYLSIVVGELVPKRIALADAEGMAKRVAKPLTVFQKIARPLVVADAGFRRRSRAHLAHQERRRPPERLRGGDQLHDQRAGHPARRGEAHHP